MADNDRATDERSPDSTTMFDNDDYDAMFSSTTTTTTDDEDDYNVRRWKLGDHRMKPTVDAAALRRDAEQNAKIDADLAIVLEQAAKQVESASVRDFQCPVCGLSHGHSDDKHDIRSSFAVTEQFAEMMDMNPACHCGVNEMAVIADFYGYVVPQVFEDDDRFVPFEEMLPSDEADTAMALLNHPDLVAGDTTPRRKYRLMDAELRDLADGKDLGDTEYRASYQQILRASRLSDTPEMVESMKALDNRLSNIRSAANSAPIPKATEADLDAFRQKLERQTQQ